MIIRTLNPAKLLASDLVQSIRSFFPTLYYDFEAPTSRTPFIDFPTKTPPGFLYYHAPPTIPPPAHAVRFRVANSIEGFASGPDLLGRDGLPWEVPTYLLPLTPSLSPILSTLVNEDALLSSDVVSRIKQLYPAGWGVTRPFYVIHSLGQVFSLALNRKKVLLSVASPTKVRTMEFYTEFLGPGPYKKRPLWYDGPVHVSIDYVNPHHEFANGVRITRPMGDVNRVSADMAWPLCLSTERGLDPSLVYLDRPSVSLPTEELSPRSPSSPDLAHNAAFASLPGASPITIPTVRQPTKLSGTFITRIERAPLRWPEHAGYQPKDVFEGKGLARKWEIRPHSRAVVHGERWAGQGVVIPGDRTKLGLPPVLNPRRTAGWDQYKIGVEPGEVLSGLLEWEQMKELLDASSEDKIVG